MIHEDLQQHLIQRPSHLAAAQGHFHQNGETDDADNRKNDEDDQVDGEVGALFAIFPAMSVAFGALRAHDTLVAGVTHSNWMLLVPTEARVWPNALCESLLCRA